ncbi:hypothetical protein R1sor_011023 [Riccia sorocarpa]|uniref:Myb/SANT-like DNA-binding domain-containing protein n=1 Tax=Riccia sorocarpa TaxID=122646 RepID=A0ABD3HZQ1_9MARC
MERTTHNPIAIESDIEILQHERIGDSQAAANVAGAKSKKKPTKKRKTDSGRFNDATQIIPPLGIEKLRNKFDSLYKRYKAEKHKQSQTGAEPSSWELYEQMHRIKGDSPKEQAEGFVTSPVETPVQTPPTTPEGDQSAASPRTKAYSQPEVVGQKNKKRRASKNNDDGMKTCMLEFTQVVKETNERKSAQEDRKFDFMVAQEQGKMNLMSQMLELKRMELDILRDNQRGPPPS